MIAVAERPNGERVAFLPLPTPIFRDGALVGAVNMLIDVTDVRQTEELRAQAERCRRLARGLGDRQAADILTAMAAEYAAKSAALEQASPLVAVA